MLTKDKLELMRVLVDGMTKGTTGLTDKGVDVMRAYCEDFLDFLEECDDVDDVTMTLLLNGADDWYQYSWGGCSLVYTYDLAERLLTADEFEQWKNDEFLQEKQDGTYFLNLQAGVLQYASSLIIKFWNSVK